MAHAGNRSAGRQCRCGRGRQRRSEGPERPSRVTSGVCALSHVRWEAIQVTVAGALWDWTRVLYEKWMGFLKYVHPHVQSNSVRSSHVDRRGSTK